MKRLLPFILLLSLLPFALYSQETPVSYRYKGGTLAFLKYLAQNTNYPSASRENLSYGFSISRLVLAPTGEIKDLSIVSPLDRYLDQEVLRVVGSTDGSWLSSDSIKHDQVIFIQMDFIFFGIAAHYCQSKVPAFKSLYTEPVIINTSLQGRLPESDNALVKKYHTLLSEGKSKKALDAISELIKRDPFIKDFYKARADILRSSGKIPEAEADENRIKDFGGGIPLDSQGCE